MRDLALVINFEKDFFKAVEEKDSKKVIQLLKRAQENQIEIDLSEGGWETFHILLNRSPQHKPIDINEKEINALLKYLIINQVELIDIADIVNNEGETPLTLAIKFSNYSAANMLLEASSQLSAQNYVNAYALLLAKNSKKAKELLDRLDGWKDTISYYGDKRDIVISTRKAEKDELEFNPEPEIVQRQMRLGKQCLDQMCLAHEKHENKEKLTKKLAALIVAAELGKSDVFSRLLSQCQSSDYELEITLLKILNKINPLLVNDNAITQQYQIIREQIKFKLRNSNSKTISNSEIKEINIFDVVLSGDYKKLKSLLIDGAAFIPPLFTKNQSSQISSLKFYRRFLEQYLLYLYQLDNSGYIKIFDLLYTEYDDLINFVQSDSPITAAIEEELLKFFILIENLHTYHKEIREAIKEKFIQLPISQIEQIVQKKLETTNNLSESQREIFKIIKGVAANLNKTKQDQTEVVTPPQRQTLAPTVHERTVLNNIQRVADTIAASTLAHNEKENLLRINFENALLLNAFPYGMPVTNSPNQHGMTSLLLAAQRGDYETFRLSLLRGEKIIFHQKEYPEQTEKVLANCRAILQTFKIADSNNESYIKIKNILLTALYSFITELLPAEVPITEEAKIRLFPTKLKPILTKQEGETGLFAKEITSTMEREILKIIMVTENFAAEEIRQVIKNNFIPKLHEEIRQRQKMLPQKNTLEAMDARESNELLSITMLTDPTNPLLIKELQGKNIFDLVKIPSEKNLLLLILLFSQTKPDVDTPNSEGQTPLFLAAQSGNYPAFKLLLLHGAKTVFSNQEQATSTEEILKLHREILEKSIPSPENEERAQENENFNQISYLLSQVVNMVIMTTSSNKMTRKIKNEMLRIFILAKSDPINHRETLEIIKNKFIESLTRKLKKQLTKIERKDYKATKMALDYPKSFVDKIENPSILFELIKDHSAKATLALKLILDYAQFANIHTPNSEGNTPILAAAEIGNYEAFKLLLLCGANPENDAKNFAVSTMISEKLERLSKDKSGSKEKESKFKNYQKINSALQKCLEYPSKHTPSPLPNPTFTASFYSEPLSPIIKKHSDPIHRKKRSPSQSSASSPPSPSMGTSKFTLLAAPNKSKSDGRLSESESSEQSSPSISRHPSGI